MSKQLELQEKRFELQMQMHQEQIQKLNSGIPISVSQEAQTSSFEPFNPSQELWKDYSDRFFTFVKANAISEQRMPHVFLSNQSRETFQLIKTAASQMPTPKNINALSWGEIFSIMSTNFSQRTFVVRERHRFYTELKRKSDESVSELASRVRQKANTCDFAPITDPLDEALKTGFICAVNNEAVLKAIFHKSTRDLNFSQIVDIAAEVEEASRTAQQQISEDVEEVCKISQPIKKNTFASRPVKGQCFSCGGRGHWRQDCNYRNAVCTFCQVEGHISRACRKRGNTPKQSKPQFDDVNNVISSVRDKILHDLVINNFNIRFEIDTGSVDSFISHSNWIKLGKPTLRKVVNL
ncbi:hypothetical protein RF11_02204 [Thelohanellus kitauei]|uniref:CCHC-type domain-containing protein n=1 Tax=Thelohanellus kitauei TaxID=669202 RepID=A0A0C2M8S2_THEKT|nr:hypothetical protein RF11_02204 [Thelohanellus kitauei]